MKKKEYSLNTTEGPIFRKIVTFTVPLILSGILQLLFNTVDMVVAGRFAGKVALAAIGSTSSLINLLVNVFMGLSVGGNVLVARFFGSGRNREVHETVHTSISLSLLSGVTLAFIGIAFAPKLLVLMGTPVEVLPDASLYIRIYFAGMPVQMLYNFGAAILRAIGDTKRPLRYLTFAGAVNAVCNVIFIVAFGMGVDGVAYATVLSQTISAVLIVKCLMETDESYKLEIKKLRIYKDKLLMILRVGLPAGFQGAIFSISNVLIQSSINSFGPDAMAGSTASSNLEGFVYVSMNSVHHTCLSFTSQNYGANRFDRIKKIFAECMGVVAGVGIILGTLAYLLGPVLLSIYAGESDREVVIYYGMIRMTVIMLTYFTCGMMDVCVGAMRGLGYSILPMIVSLLGACGLRVLWILTIFKFVHSLNILYISYPVSWIITTLAHLICFYFGFKKAKEKIQY